MIRNKLTFFAPKHVDWFIPSVQRTRGKSFTRLRQPGRDADNSSPSSAKVNNKHSFTFTPLQDRIACTRTTLPLTQVVLLVIPVPLTQKRDDKFSFMNWFYYSRQANENWDRYYTLTVLNQLVISAIVITLVDEALPSAISLLARNKDSLWKGYWLGSGYSMAHQPEFAGNGRILVQWCIVNNILLWK